MLNIKLLTRTEKKIWNALTSSGQLTRKDILGIVYGNLIVSKQTIDVHLCNLRKKLKNNGMLLKLYNNHYQIEEEHI